MSEIQDYDEFRERLLMLCGTEAPMATIPALPAQSDWERQRAECKARKQAIDEEFGDEVRFAQEFQWHVGGTPVSAAKTLNDGSYAFRILKGQSCYERKQWHYPYKHEVCVVPTQDERKALSAMFGSAAKKLDEIGGKVRSGKLDAAVRERLESYGFLTKGGTHGRWMCDSLADEMERIGDQLI